MRRIVRLVITGLIMAVSVGIAATSPVYAGGAAGEARDEVCAGLTTGGGVCNDNQGEVNTLIATIVKIISFIAGVVTVLMIIVAGFKYITSGGDSSKVTSAKNTIIFALIGLVIVLLSQIIVRFVINRVK